MRPVPPLLPAEVTTIATPALWAWTLLGVLGLFVLAAAYDTAQDRAATQIGALEWVSPADSKPKPSPTKRMMFFARFVLRCWVMIRRSVSLLYASGRTVMSRTV